jgi:hypothetical protein
LAGAGFCAADCSEMADRRGRASATTDKSELTMGSDSLMWIAGKI